jgi:hypothetical protein
MLGSTDKFGAAVHLALIVGNTEKVYCVWIPLHSQSRESFMR